MLRCWESLCRVIRFPLIRIDQTATTKSWIELNLFLRSFSSYRNWWISTNQSWIELNLRCIFSNFSGVKCWSELINQKHRHASKQSKTFYDINGTLSEVGSCLRMRCLIFRCARISWIHVGESLTQWCFWDFVKQYQIISYLGHISGIFWHIVSISWR